ncbi:RNA polymerase sigma factor [Psychroserpens sp.]|uniref:RNA polymerase sigma factor n=1 Tax=Psychroserpens sp. TaxID=2020870 RepID=UPI003859D653
MILTNQNIEQLLQLCKSGDQHAQMEVYNRYYKAMYNTALRIVKDSFEAEDIMQDSFLTAFTKLDNLKEIKTFGSWLKRIVINNSIYHYKKNNKYNDVPLDDVLYKVEDHSGIGEVETFSSIKANQILDTMKLLKDNYRMGLTLHLIEGYDYEEICEIMNITNANCRTLISRAKESLRKKLAPLAS